VTALSPFDFHGNSVRVHIDERGEPWFVAQDVALVLGFRDGYTMSRWLESDKVRDAVVPDTDPLKACESSNNRRVRIVSEAGLYSLILRSNVEAAKPFKEWVTREVLPSIRKTGSYGAPRELTFAERVAGVLGEAQRIIEEQKRQLAEAAPKVEFVDRYVEAEGLYGLQQAGRVLGHGPNKFIEQLKRSGFLFYQGRALVPQADLVDRGFFEVKTFVATDGKARVQTYVTPAGVEWLARRLGRGSEVLS
jgi:prophage antirepressor-like protein